MKYFYSLILALLFSGSLNAQAYFIVQSTGTAGGYVYNAAGTNILTTGNQVLSAWQSLPFAWNFYGAPVTGYYASDNGYITFDAGAATSIAANTTLPNAAGPTNSICAFWDDFTVDNLSGNPDLVRKFTYGTAPNRVHCIQWWSMTPTGSATWIYTTIRLYEGGDFDIVQDYAAAAAAAATNGTIGCQNQAKNDGTYVVGAPTSSFPALGTAANDDIVYTFNYGAQQAYDMEVTSSNFPGTVNLGNNTVGGVITNLGSSTITAFDLNYSVNGGATQTQSLAFLNIPGSGGTYNFSHGTMWNVPTGGQYYDLRIWATNLNGNADQNNANDTLTQSLLANLGISGTKRTVIEEFTGAWCQFCPDGTVILEQIEAANPGQTFSVSVHDGDAMEFVDGIRTNFNVTSYPGGQIDRFHFSGEVKVPVSRGSWTSYNTTRLGAYTPVNVSLSNTYNPGTREVNATIQADFVDYAVGDLRFVLWVTEDSVTGTGSGYNQVNFYNTQAGHPYFGAGNPIIGFVHNHTLRSLPGTWRGNAGVITSVANPNDQFTENFTFTLPGNWNSEKIELVGGVYSYQADVLDGEVLNVAGGPLGGLVALDPLSEKDQILGVYPNPVSGIGSARVFFTEITEASFEIYNMLGQQVALLKRGIFAPGEHTVFFETAQAPEGVYLLTVRTPHETFTQKIIITK